MDYVMIGPYQFDRDASKDDMRLDYCSSFQEVALDESSLSFDTVSVEVCTTTIGAQLSALPNNTPIIVYRGGEIKARFVSSGVSRIGPVTYQLTGRSPMGALTGMVHTGGIYTGQTVEEVVKEICGNIPSLIKSVYAGVKLYGWLPYADGKERSARDNLAQVLFAIGAYLRTDLNGVLRIEPLWDGTASLIDVDRSYTGGTVKYDAPISAVTVTEHQYVAGTEVKELFSGTAQNGDIITFSEPMHSLSATGFTILESGANYAKISAGTGALTGKAYIHNTRLITQPVTAGAVENIKSVTDATLVSLVNSYAVAKRLADYYRCRETITNDIVSGHEKPGHVVSVYHPYDKKMVSACIQSLDTTMSATLKSSMEALVGFTPAQPESAEYFDERVVLTGAGEWEVPAGVNTLKAVLFSGAQGGQAGLKGGTSSGSKTHNHTYTSSITGKVTSQAQAVLWGGPGGAGGAGGPGGKGAKILDVTLSPAAGAKIAYSCGKGSPGAAYNPESTQEAAEGGVTQFGDATSDAGNYSETGWTDPITGEVYGAPGEDGLPGGNGAGAIDGYTIPDNSWDLDEVLKYQPSTPAIDEDGNVWPGATTKEKEGQEQVAYWETFTTDSSGYYGAWAGYALGPGGAAGVTQSEPTIRGSNTTSSATAADGVTGATPTLIPKKAKLTQGGRGGYGGGGGSCASWAGYEKDPSKTSQNMRATEGKPGEGGNGGTGGEAGDGCIILYYRRPKAVQSGPLATSDGKWLLDALDRRMIV